MEGNYLKFIRYREKEQIQGALIDDLNFIYNIPFNNYVEFYYMLKNSSLTVKQFIKNNDLKPIEKRIDEIELLIPIVPDEIWASGVTYLKSKEARNYEATNGELDRETFYDKVYDAPRPELFLKSTGRRVVGPNSEVFIRRDSNWQIPEPELTLILGEGRDIIGYTLGNDMSCRDIEGENPLYLPQAKVWKNSCSIGPAILIAESVEDPYAIDLTCRIYRNNELIFEGSAVTSQLKRKLDELVEYLVYDNDLLPGTALMTGTCIVPPNDFTLQLHDHIEIFSTQIGSLKNEVNINNLVMKG